MKATLLFTGFLFSTLAFAESVEPHRTPLRAPQSAAEPRANTTPEQRQEIVATTHSLEKAAFRRHAATERETALWTIDHAPDIFPRLQASIITDVIQSGVPDWRPIYAQFILGFVSFQLERPEHAHDPVAVYHAACESCLHVYRQAVHRDEVNRIPMLDELETHQKNGRLRQYVSTLVASFPN